MMHSSSSFVKKEEKNKKNRMLFNHVVNLVPLFFFNFKGFEYKISLLISKILEVSCL